MKLAGNCQTTAMGIMPHTDVKRAIELALSLDPSGIPYGQLLSQAWLAPARCP